MISKICRAEQQLINYKPVLGCQICEKLSVVIHPLVKEVDQAALQSLPVLRCRVLRVEVGGLQHLNDLVVDSLPDVSLHVSFGHEEQVVLEEIPEKTTLRSAANYQVRRDLPGGSHDLVSRLSHFLVPDLADHRWTL